MAIWLALVSAALAVPRPVPPDHVPAPTVDRRALAASYEDEAALAAQARARPLSYGVRAVGELFRRYGKLEARGSGNLGALQRDLRRAAGAARVRAPRELEALLAVQTELFLEALSRYEQAGQASVELDELAGPLLKRAEESAWFESGRFVASRSERRTLFRMRWLELTGLRGRAPFAPSLDEWRVYYGFLIEHPDVRGGARERAVRRLGYVAALAKKDPSYPRLLAQGVLQYHMGAFDEAADAFRAALAREPDGPYVLRAKNHLLAALAKAEGAE